MADLMLAAITFVALTAIAVASVYAWARTADAAAAERADLVEALELYAPADRRRGWHHEMCFVDPRDTAGTLEVGEPLCSPDCPYERARCTIDPAHMPAAYDGEHYDPRPSLAQLDAACLAASIDITQRSAR